MKDLPIGIFDSGIGGLTIANAIKKQLPYENIIYFGDTQHLPYGEKSSKAIQKFSKRITKFLIKKKCKAIVIACNSASSVALEIIEKMIKEIPVFNVIDPVINALLKEAGNKNNIGVIGTKATIQSKIYSAKIKNVNNKMKVHALATPLLAPMIEEGFISEEISHKIIAKYLSNPALKNIDHLILACTHYPLIHAEIKNFYKGNVNVIDSGGIIAKHIACTLHKMNLIKETQKTENTFYVSNYTASFEKSAKFFFKEHIKLVEVSLSN